MTDPNDSITVTRKELERALERFIKQKFFRNVSGGYWSTFLTQFEIVNWFTDTLFTNRPRSMVADTHPTETGVKP